MSRTTVIWNHNHLQVWRPRGASAELLYEAEVDSVDALVLALEKETQRLRISKLRVYLDCPELDYHIERIPKMTSKLQQQLLEQRKIKLYGNEDRVWISNDMALGPAGTQHFYFITSLPNAVSHAIVEFAARNAILLEGIFSLPLALATATASDEKVTDEAQVRFHALGNAGYLIARDAKGKLLFLSRLDTSRPSDETLDTNLRRLLLFLEQEFTETPKMVHVGEKDTIEDASIVSKMSKQRAVSRLKLISKLDRNQQNRQRLRQRGFALLSIGLIVTLYANLPLMQKKRALELSLSNINNQITTEEQTLQTVKESIEKINKYKLVIDFNEGRQTIKIDNPTPSPLLVMMRAFSNAMPDFVELDSYEGYIDLTSATATITMEGRPLTADINLSEKIKKMHDTLKKNGWLISDSELSFEKKLGRSRFSNQQGEKRKFILRFQINARGEAN